MQNEIVAGALFLLTFISPTPASPSLGGSAPALQTSQIKQETITYAVQEKDTLGSIAEKNYGSGEFWTNIWNDNEWIEDPDIIEKTWKLKIQKEKPEKPADIKKELSDKLLEKKKMTLTMPIQAQSKTNDINQPENPQTQDLSIPTPDPKPVVTGTTEPLNDTQINFLGNCESGMTAGRNSGNGYYGAFQFSPGTWRSMGTAYARADLAPLEVQIDATQRLVSRSSIYTQFPGCAAKMRAAGLL